MRACRTNPEGHRVVSPPARGPVARTPLLIQRPGDRNRTPCALASRTVQKRSVKTSLTAGRLDGASGGQGEGPHIDDAQRMAGKLDQSANSRAGEAAKLIADVLDAEAKR